MFFEAALVNKADLAERCYVDVKAREFVGHKGWMAFRTVAVSRVQHSPDVPTGIVKDLFVFLC